MVLIMCRQLHFWHIAYIYIVPTDSTNGVSYESVC